MKVTNANVADVFNEVVKAANLSFTVLDGKTVLVTPRKP